VRLVVVLGYSRGRRSGIDPIARARVAHAASFAREGDVVVLSGTPKEAREMAELWADASAVVVDRAARHTVDSAAFAARLAASLAAGEVVVVTSWWHVPRAWLLARLLVARRVRVSGSPARGPWSPSRLVRELALLPFAPLQAALSWPAGTETRPVA
jgi:uncharacterized SAM-binding protein YcdF (DUF218 family)